MIEKALENASNVIGRLQGIAPDAELPLIEASSSFETKLVEHEQKECLQSSGVSIVSITSLGR